MYWLDRYGDSSTQIYGDGPNLKMLFIILSKTRQGTHSVMPNFLIAILNLEVVKKSSPDIIICFALPKKKKSLNYGVSGSRKIVNGKLPNQILMPAGPSFNFRSVLQNYYFLLSFSFLTLWQDFHGWIPGLIFLITILASCWVSSDMSNSLQTH